MNIVAISGSLRKDSYNTQLVHALQALAPEGVTVEVAGIKDVPLYNGDDEADYPAAAQALKDKIEAADALFIATPEYNRSIPGVLKNAIDWASRPYGKNSFQNKVVITAGVSSGKIGTAVAQSHLRQVLVYLGAQVVGQPELYVGPAAEVFAPDGEIRDEKVKELLQTALEALQARAGK
jgi:chromate reductase